MKLHEFLEQEDLTFQNFDGPKRPHLGSLASSGYLTVNMANISNFFAGRNS